MENFINTIEYCFVIDKRGVTLAPTKVNKGWYLVRHKRAKLIQRYPMVIQLLREVEPDEYDGSKIVCGIDDGSKYVGIAIIQECPTKNKLISIGTIQQRQDVKSLMDARRNYRSYRRQHKRYRPKRVNNRASSKRKCRLAPTILQKKQSILRVINRILKWIHIKEYYLEDVAMDIRAMIDGYKPFAWKYAKSNRLDENIRRAVIMRDKNTCQECGITGCAMEIHHIKARKYHGATIVSNLITLCPNCHHKTHGHEKEFEAKYYAKIKSKSLRLDNPMHVMVGKTYLREELSKLGNLIIVSGGTTANYRIDWGYEKSHAIDAICTTGLKPYNINVKHWTIRPMRRKRQSKYDSVLGFKHRDYIEYMNPKTKESYRGYVTAIDPKLNRISFQTLTKRFRNYSARNCTLVFRFNKIYWLDYNLYDSVESGV